MLLRDEVDFSQLPRINTGNQEGRFLFRITQEKPERGGCTALESKGFGKILKL